MLVRDFMTANVTTLQENETLLDARLIFARSSIRHIPILDRQQLVGIVTERDLKHYTPSILSGIPPEEFNRLVETTPLARIMTRDPLTIRPDEPMLQAAQILYDRRIGCLPVVEDGKLRGIVTTSDMLKLLVRLLKGDAGPVEPVN